MATERILFLRQAVLELRPNDRIFIAIGAALAVVATYLTFRSGGTKDAP